MIKMSDNFEARLRASISFAWHVFAAKVGAKLIEVNKEASMQLHYSYILQQIIPLICCSKDEQVKIELATGVTVEGKSKEIDLVLTGIKDDQKYKIAVEMKCYRKYASSGRKRGATDIFMKDVYEDLSLLESYCEMAGFDHGVSLVMNDLENFVNPKNKNAKWQSPVILPVKALHGKITASRAIKAWTYSSAPASAPSFACGNSTSRGCWPAGG